MYQSIITIVLIVNFARFGTAQSSPTLVKNLNPEANSSSPRNLYSVNNMLYFTADDEEGEKLFRTDGTEDGTVAVPYTPPAGMVLARAAALNGQWYVLLLEKTGVGVESAQKVNLARTDFNSTTIIQTLSTSPYPVFKDFSAKNGKLFINYSYVSGSIGSERFQSFIVHNGNSNGIVLSKTSPATATYKAFENENVLFLEENYKARRANAQDLNRKTLYAANNGGETTLLNETWAANTPAPYNLFSTIGIASNKIQITTNDALVSFSTAGARTNLKTGIDVIAQAKTAGEILYFMNNRRELWKTDGSLANIVQLTANFEAADEVVINLFGGGTSAYVVTLSGNTTRTYCINAQNSLTRVNAADGVTYFQPFVSKGVQYVFANKATGVANCAVPSLIQYGQTAAQTKSHELGDKSVNVETCDNSLPNPTHSLLMDNDIFYYAMQTTAYGNELWKLNVKGGVAPPPPPSENYCASNASAPWELYISTVGLGNIANNSGKFKDFSTLGYSNFTNLSTNLVKGQSYPVSVTPTLSWNGNLPNTYCSVWIDFNKNNVFEDNELVLGKGNQNPFTQTFTVPADAVAGSTRMRVSVKNGGQPTACETFDKGEVEDYTINIVAAAQTPTVSGKVKSEGLGFEIYPNPTKDKAVVDLKNFVAKKVTLFVSDAAGKVVLTQTIDNVTNTSYELPIQTLETGSYFVTIQANGSPALTGQLQVAK
jgi:hypothetical protein